MPQHQNSELKSGLIIVGDVVNFSSLPPANMPRVLTALWRTAENARLLQGDSSTLLDGIVIANPSVEYRSAVDACGQWLASFHADRDSCDLRLRIAVHRGDYCRVFSNRSSSHLILAGQGPNECSRLVRMAGPGQMVISQDYIDAWSHYEGWGSGNPGESENFRPIIKFDPRHDQGPHKFVIKQGRESRFRYYKHNLDERDVPREILLKDRARQGLEQWIRETAEDFLDVVGSKLKSNDQASFDNRESPADDAGNEIDLRVSLFVLDTSQPNAEQLGSLLRYSRREGPKWLGSTQYSVGSGQVEGPLGLAFVQKKTYVLKGLPSFEENPRQYIDVLAGPPWNVNEQKVSGFQRKARCFLATPLAMSETIEPEAVLCIDSMEPLYSIDEDLLKMWSDHIADSYGVLVSALLSLVRL